MKLNCQQEKAVFKLSSNTLVTASPGSGKTRTLVARAIHKISSLPKHKTIALITYTNAGAEEIASRLDVDKDIFVGTIHCFCLEHILRPFGWIFKWRRPCIISYEQQQDFFEENPNIDLGYSGSNELGKIQKNLDGTLDTTIDWSHSIPLEEVAQKYYDYQEKLGVIDFNEILYRSYKIINTKSFVAASLSSKFFEISIDEFQDTNLYQYEILKAINNNGDCTFFMVGDDKQRIFAFAGAIENAFDKAEKDFNAEVQILTKTYRSSNHIVNAYSKLFSDHPKIENSSECKGFEESVYCIKTDKTNHSPYLKGIIEQLVKDCNIDLSEIAILSTSWFEAFNASKTLRSGYDVVGLGALPHRSVNSSSMNLLRALAKYINTPNIRRIRSIKRYIDVHLLEKGLIFSEKALQKKTNNLIKGILNIPSERTLLHGLKSIKTIFETVFETNHSSFQEVIEALDDTEKNTWNIGKYLKTLAGVGGITSNTIHKAKGLEFDAVILNQMNENKIPYQKFLSKNPWTYQSLDQEGIKNGKNLFYVGISRARKYLIILHNWKPSMFLEQIQ